MKKRLIIGLVTGALLGVVCIVGASLRSTETLSTIYLFSFWFNRVVMGFVFALLPSIKDYKLRLARGVIIGLFISFMFYSATEFQDLMGFLAGGVYGIILEVVLEKVSQKTQPQI
jgi:hypothetical protein